jgi:cytochrome b
MTATVAKGAHAAPDAPRSWDFVVRLTHWTIAAAVIANGLLTKAGGVWHVWIGWIAMGALALRLIWGLVGTRQARFAAFPPDPKAALGHLSALARGRAAEHPSHNPAGALMAYAFWACLAVVVATGLTMTGGKSPMTVAAEKAAVAAGDWSALVDDTAPGDHDGDEESGETALDSIAEALHESAANLMLALALVHVAGVAVESRALGRNLALGMTVGRRR